MATTGASGNIPLLILRPAMAMPSVAGSSVRGADGAGTGHAGGLIHGTRELQAGYGPAARLVGRAGRAAVCPRDSAHDGQPEASCSFAAGPAGVGWAGETLEGVRQVLGREPGAAVADFDARACQHTSRSCPPPLNQVRETQSRDPDSPKQPGLRGR
jgi:hypothetical protein